MEEQVRFISAIVPPGRHSGSALWFAFQESRLLIHQESPSLTVPCLSDFSQLGMEIVRQNYLGMLGSRPCYAVELRETVSAPDGMAFEGLRQLYGRLDEDLFRVAVRAVQIVDWDRTHQFCSRCGTKTEASTAERSKKCPQCGLLQFPRLAPAVIVLVERGNQLLLARSRHFAAGMYSVLAGFVEPGESLEEAVAREIREEVDISIKEIRYFGSQPWPFPHSLMIGFTAKYAGGEVTLQDSEIEDAGWFTADSLPPLPGKISIARKLIDSFLAKHQHNFYGV
jgi:NAD+ diphosphatase